MADFYNDGAIPHGSFIANFSIAGAIKLENFNAEDPGKVIARPDEKSAPNGWAGVQEQETATAVAQIPTDAGSPLTKGDFFVADNAHGADKWVITRLGTRFQLGDYWKVEVSFHKAYF